MADQRGHDPAQSNWVDVDDRHLNRRCPLRLRSWFRHQADLSAVKGGAVPVPVTASLAHATASTIPPVSGATGKDDTPGERRKGLSGETEVRSAATPTHRFAAIRCVEQLAIAPSPAPEQPEPSFAGGIKVYRHTLGFSEPFCDLCRACSS